MKIDFLEEVTDSLFYLPEYYEEIREFQELAKVVNIEMNELKKAINLVMNEQYIQSAEKTLEWREGEFNIIANANETLEFRRERLIERKSRKPPITIRNLKNLLNQYIDTQNVEIELIPGEYAFVVKMPAVDGFKYKDIQKIIEQVKPANMEYVQNPFGLERIRIVETSTEKKIVYAQAGLAIVGKTRVGTVISEKAVYNR